MMPGVIKPRKTLRHHKIPTDQEAYDICCGMSFVLDKLYPGYLWQVGMNQDVVYIQNMTLSTDKGFVLPLSEFDVEGKVLMRTGGELLERFGVKRGKRNQADVVALPKDIRQNVIPVN